MFIFYSFDTWCTAYFILLNRRKNRREVMLTVIIEGTNFPISTKKSHSWDFSRRFFSTEKVVNPSVFLLKIFVKILVKSNILLMKTKHFPSIKLFLSNFELIPLRPFYSINSEIHCNSEFFWQPQQLGIFWIKEKNLTYFPLRIKWSSPCNCIFYPKLYK